MKFLVGIAAGLGWIIVAGCSDPSARSPREPQQSTESAELAAAPVSKDTMAAPVPAINLEVADEQQLNKAVQQCQGRPVLVDFWATWCVPCVELFPHTVELHRKHSQNGLAVISVSLDDPESEAEVRQFLTRQGADFPNFISRYGLGPQSVEAFGITEGALPHLKLYDRSGKLHREFVAGQCNPEQIDDAIEELLKET